MNKTRIISGTDWGGNFTEDFLIQNSDLVINGQLVSDWELTEILPNLVLKKPNWNGTEWIESYVEVIVAPEEISAMDLKLQLFDLGIIDQDIFDDIDSIPDSMFPLPKKQKAKIKYLTAAKFERSNADLNLVATMEGLTQQQIDQIFINGKIRS